MHHRAFADCDTLAADRVEDDGGQFRVALAERGQAFEDGDLGSETPVRLGHLHADRAAADDDQMAREVAIVE